MDIKRIVSNLVEECDAFLILLSNMLEASEADTARRRTPTAADYVCAFKRESHFKHNRVHLKKLDAKPTCQPAAPFTNVIAKPFGCATSRKHGYIDYGTARVATLRVPDVTLHSDALVA